MLYHKIKKLPILIRLHGLKLITLAIYPLTGVSIESV